MGINYGPGPVLMSPSCPDLFEWGARRDAEMAAIVGEVGGKLYSRHWDATIFPNCSYLIGTYVFKAWHPIGPDKVEVMTWAFGEKDMPDDLKQRLKVAVHRVFGTAGVLEADDLDSFEYIALPNQGYVTREGLMNCQMGMGTEREDPNLPGVLGDFMSEHAQRGFYRTWADCMSSSSWAELEAATANWKQDLLRK
jgi:Ring hydroxylating alpha subunit (catalytic domain)